MKIERKKVIQILEESLNKFCEDFELDNSLSEGESTKLFGSDGVLDSIGLVSFIVFVEEVLEDEFDISIVLADEKAMSRRTSPFSRISYLADYILELIDTNSNE